MSMINCKKHGYKIGENVSHSVREVIMGGSPPREIIPVTLQIEDMEFPSYIGTWEVPYFERELSEKFTDKNYIYVNSDDKLNTFLKTITVVCLECLNEYLNSLKK